MDEVASPSPPDPFVEGTDPVDAGSPEPSPAPAAPAPDLEASVAFPETAADTAEPPHPVPVAPAPFAVTVEYRERICYALAYNRVPTITSIVVENTRGGITGPLTITAAVRWTVSDQPLMHPFSATVDAPAIGDRVVLGVDACRDFRVDDTAVVDLTETATATLEVTVRDAAGAAHTVRHDLTVLSRNQWLNDADLFELSAAFVQPNHPVVTDVLARAGEIMAERGEVVAFEGYQSNPERALQMGRSIFEALQSYVDRYVNPPASYDEEGQKVRPLDEVLAQRQGTCIDLAFAYASCLEQAGLSPAIILYHGHANAGFFLEDPHDLIASVETDFTTIVNLIESGRIVVAETTVLTEELPFAEALVQARDHLKERSIQCSICLRLVQAGIDPSSRPHVQALVNIVACHRKGVRPLPARVEREGVVTIVIDNGPAHPPITERRDAKTNRVLPNTVPARVQQWKNSLLDLSFRNVLLNYKPEKTGAPLVVPSSVIGKIEDHLSAGDAVLVVPHDQINDAQKEAGARFARDLPDVDRLSQWSSNHAVWAAVEAESFGTRVRRLVSRARLDEQETGANNLYLTLGSLKWTDPRSSAGTVTSPIFLIPIRLVMKRGQTVAVIKMDENASTTVNYCLIEALRVKHQLPLTFFSGDMSDTSGIDVETALRELRKEILDKGLTHQGFDVIEDGSIGFLRFNKIRLWKDLDDHWEHFAQNAVVSHLIQGGRGRFVDPNNTAGTSVSAPLDPEQLNPQPADGAQAVAIKRALLGHSFVLEGPPGTGKSQTITNLLANALARGKKVLFVAEKQAALSVVHERLAAVGLDPFCLELHDKGSKPDVIKTQLKAALDFSPHHDADAWEAIDLEFDRFAAILDTYRDKVHGRNDAGLSYYEAYVRLLRLGSTPMAAHTRALVHVDKEVIARYQETLGSIQPLMQAAQPRRGHPWSLATPRSFADVDRAALGSAITVLQSTIPAFAGVDPWLAPARAATTVADFEGFTQLVGLVGDGFAPGVAGWRRIGDPEWAQAAIRLVDELDQILEEASDLTASAGTILLADDQAVALAAVKAATASFVLGRKGRVRTALGPLADVAPFSTAVGPDLVALVDRLASSAGDVQAAVAKLRALPGPVVPEDWFPESRADLVAVREMISRADRVGAFLVSGAGIADEALRLSTGLARPGPGTHDLLVAAATAFGTIATELASDEAATTYWQDDRSLTEAIEGSLSAWTDDVDTGTFKGLQRWLAFVSAVASVDDPSLAGFRVQLLAEEISGFDARDALNRALMSATLVHVGQERDLDVFEAGVHGRAVDGFVSNLAKRQDLLRKVIPWMLYDARSFDAQVSTGAVGNLKQELGSNRRGARSIRDLLARYPDLIVALTPCFLMSPDSVANFLTPGKIHFDLVVFDEASQIPVASAVGALGRGTAVVVVGDSRQMPPTAVAVAGSGSDEDDLAGGAAGDDAVVSDLDSILEECVESGLSQEWLAWHYRSRDELLIKFSNDHYYDGRLSSFPSPFLAVPGCGIERVRVDGQFDHGGRRTNKVEADTIVELVTTMARSPENRGSSIGIVTLNLEQRQLIDDKLQASNDPAVRALLDSEDDSENLFILNLESVQGRERDIIILGTSFSKRSDGSRMPLTFGPLTSRGGERRLNVAVTRARRKVVVVTSFEPEELAGAGSLGMIHLREYMELARLVSGGERPRSDGTTESDEDLHREAVADAFREQGLIVGSGVGLSSFKVDLALTTPEHEGRWLVGVLLDGPSWAGRPIVADRDALPVTVLENLMGWRHVARVWLPAWRSDPDEIVSEITAKVREIAADPDPEPPEPIPLLVPDPGPKPEPDPPISSAPAPEPRPAALPNARPFVAPPTDVVRGTLDQVERRDPSVRAYAAELIERFGPIATDEVLRLVYRAHGLGKVNANRIAQARPMLPDHLITDTKFGAFAFPAALIVGGDVDRVAFTWYRSSDSKSRSIKLIAPHEVANAAVDIVRASFSIESTELANALLRAFGYTQKGKDTLHYVINVVEWSVASGYLEESDGHLRLP